MNEAEWFACADPQALLRYAAQSHPIRKFRLFAVACCRTIEPLLLKTWRGRRGLLLAEKLADGIPVAKDVAALRDQLQAHEFAFQHIDIPYGEITRDMWILYYAAGAVHAALQGEEEFRDDYASLIGMPGVSDGVANRAAMAAAHRDRTNDRRPLSVSVYRRELMRLVPLVHDIFGDPFRPAPCLDPAWLAWGDGAIRKLAETVYIDRAFDRLPVLADALEDAGCADAELLGHLRGPGPHTRGCWALDLLLAKE